VRRTSWDENAQEWARRIAADQDVSRSQVLLPAILDAVKGLNGHLVLDAGCGCGSLGSRIRRDTQREVVGVDVSLGMCREARMSIEGKLDVVCADVTALPIRRGAVDTVMANMLLGGVAELKSCLVEIGRVLRPNGTLVFSLLHPARVCPVTTEMDEDVVGGAPAGGSVWEIEGYVVERAIEARIRLGGTGWLPASVPYYHRMLSTYASALLAGGFVTVDLREPVPSAEVMERYPRLAPFWELAPFLVWIARKTA
jgi:SAM-dependent methyltransferase